MNNRIGLFLIVSSLLMITLVMGLLFQRQQDTHAAQIRIQGVGVVRSLSALPIELLAPTGNNTSVLQQLPIYYENPNFAYAVVISPDERRLAEVTSPGALIPADALPTGTASLFGERTLQSPQEKRQIREFYGPVMEQGNLKAFIRIGYFEPRQLLAMQDMQFLALLALAMFLIVPLVYFIIKRELEPLAEVGRRLHALSGENALVVSSENTSKDMRDLVGKLHTFVEAASSRIKKLELDNINTVADARLLEYGTNKMAAVLQCLPDGLLILDPSGEVTFASSKIEPLIGVSIDKVLSSSVEDWCKDVELKTLFSSYKISGFETRQQTSIEFFPIAVPHKFLHATAQALTGGMGTMSFGTLIVLRDATREHLNKQAGNDFVAHVSHELKSPLNVIAMYAEMLQDSQTDLQLRVESVNVIQDEVERMNSLVNNLLNVGKLEMGSMNPERHRIKLDDLLQDAYDNALSRAQSKSIRMDIRMPHDLTAVSIDKDLFRIAVNNLLNNAIKYSEEGGRVTLNVEEGDNEIVISVRDNGIGISVADQAHVFEKFYRAHEGEVNKRSGHGLGLYLTSQIVELHHGRLSLHSELGNGSEFSIHLKKTLSLQGANVL